MHDSSASLGFIEQLRTTEKIEIDPISTDERQRQNLPFTARTERIFLRIFGNNGI